MAEIVFANFGFWFNFLIPVAIAGYMAVTHREYIWKEFGIQAGATFAYVMVAYFLLFSTTTDLMDREFWNGKANTFTYEEGYEYKYDCSYKSCSGSGENRTCVTIPRTCEDWQPAKYYIKTSNSEHITISKSQYFRAAKKYGHKETDVYHGDQTWSSKRKGEGDRWDTYPNEIVPTSVSHSYTNYVTAAKQTVIKATINEADLNYHLKNGNLKPYPELYRDSLGATKLKRIIDTTGQADVKSLFTKLNLTAAKLGKSKQVNPIIYITNEDRTFRAALEHYWNKGKKNDAILILGVSGDKIMWSDVIAWTNNSDFIVDCGKGFETFNIKDSDNIVKRFESLIAESYKRKPMKEFEYLKENITLDWKYQVGIFLGNLIMSIGLFWYFLKNYNGYNHRSFRRFR